MSNHAKHERRDFEFPEEVKEAARQRAGYRCQRCGKSGVPLEIHHIVTIEFARKIYKTLAFELIQSLANAECLCETCHKKANRESRQNHLEYASLFLREMMMGPNPFNKDDRRLSLSRVEEQ